MDAPREFDAVVIGAGPAGSMAALTLARRGIRTLMIDKAARGRWKVCGCCLGAVGQHALRAAGLAHVLNGAEQILEMSLAARRARTSLDLRGFVSISRESLDARLADAAEAAGVRAIWNTSASAMPDGGVIFGDTRLCAGVVIDATGLRRRSGVGTARGRIGLGMTTRDAACAPGTLTMAVARGGYLGRVALPDGRVDFAMAARPALVRAQASPTETARTIWAQAGLDPGDIPDARWRGTPMLTRGASAQDGRILRLGDAAGYVEPFTGEGMSWALLGASHIAGDAIECIERGPGASNWPGTLGALLAARHARCRMVSSAVRSPMLVHAAIAAANALPRPSVAVASRLSGWCPIV